MENNSTSMLLENSSLTIVRKEKKEEKPAKLVNLKKIEYKAPILLPPPSHGYIKPKDHDFL